MFDEDFDDFIAISDAPSRASQASLAAPVVRLAAQPALASLNPLNALALAAPMLDTREGAAAPDDSPDAAPSPASLDRRRYAVRPGRHATIPGLFPRSTVNLLIGSSSAGKTNLLISQLELYANSGEFLGYRPASASERKPAQLGCLIATGTLENLHKRITARKLTALSDPTVFPLNKWKPQPDETLAAALRRHHEELSRAANHPVHLLIVEGLQLMLEGSGKVNDPKAVKDFYEVLHEFCLERHVTILGTVNQSKQLRGQSYSLLSDKIYGSIVWAQEAETLIGIEWTRLDLPEERRPTVRRVVIQPQSWGGSLEEDEDWNGAVVGAGGRVSAAASSTDEIAQPTLARPALPPRSVLYVDFDEQGHLNIVPTGALGEVESASFHRLDERLEREPEGTCLTKDDLATWGEDLGIKLRTVERWLASRCNPELDMLRRLGSNRDRTYQKPSAGLVN